ncbi:uncharacterized protein LOC127254572 [Andrographis paniculata]|uniref:uncharacterized protein LOC127254572 n=1 Tax=Andrographis paniculata TaxID=175694 RepID=UPI0021E8EF7D|nr:uncharacterized protein LOC127254572 [Andrographis paniculata]
MVELPKNSAVESTAAEEGKAAGGGDPSLESKKPSTPNELLDGCLPELEENSLSFTDSFLNFDCIDGWFEENSDLPSGGNMTDLGIGGELGSVDCKKDEVEGALSAQNGPLCDLEKNKRANEECDKTVHLIVGSVIEERFGRVSLAGPTDGLIPKYDVVRGFSVASSVEIFNPTDDVVGAAEKVADIPESNHVTERDDAEDDDENSSSSDSESESESSSSSSSDDDDVEEEEKKKEIGVEEGEIVLSDADEMVGWSDTEDGDGDSGAIGGPIRSKNELKELPPVPPITVSLELQHQTHPVGTISSILGAQVIVEGVENHNPLAEGSILWITESRLPLGIVDEIFGPVKSPYYIVRYNSEAEIPSNIQQGTPISYVQEFAKHVLNDKSLYEKGYDASGKDDEELSDIEFSDDEKEAEYKRMLKMKKRVTNESNPGNKRKDKRPVKNPSRNWNSNRRDQHSTPSGSNQNNNQDRPPPIPIVAGDQHSASSGMTRQNMPPGAQPIAAASPHWPVAQGPAFAASSGIWSSGFQPLGGVPWTVPQQPNQPFLAPLPANMVPFQQQVGTFPQFTFALNPLLAAQANFGAGGWPQAPAMNAVQFGTEQVVRPPQGFQANPGAMPNFNQSRGGGGGRRGGRPGRFDGRRGRGNYQRR